MRIVEYPVTFHENEPSILGHFGPLGIPRLVRGVGTTGVGTKVNALGLRPYVATTRSIPKTHFKIWAQLKIYSL